MKKKLILTLVLLFIPLLTGCNVNKDTAKNTLNLTARLDGTNYMEYKDDRLLERPLIVAMEEQVFNNQEAQLKKIQETAKKGRIENNTSQLPDISEDRFQKDKICVNNSSYKIPQELLEEFYDLMVSYGANCSFYAVNLEDNMSFGYNPDEEYETASTIKAPYVLYCFKEIEKGNGSLEEKKLYENRLYTYGSGELQFHSFGGTYTLEELIYYTIVYSDNIGYNMLNDRFGIEGYNKMLKELKCDEYYRDNNTLWGKASARSAALIWKEIYNFSKRSDYGAKYMNLLQSALYSYIQPGVPQFKTAHKSGWIDEQCHDTGIVFSEHPYIITVMVETGGNWGSEYQIELLTRKVNEVMENYNQWKIDERYKEVKDTILES